MRSAQVLTNLVCNQACLHCNRRAPRDAPRTVHPAAVTARIDEALGTGISELLFTGGEPTMRRDLTALIAHAARTREGVSVGLETNATLLDEARVAAWKEAGLAFARVNLAAFSAVVDELTRDPGGFERTRQGLTLLARAGIPIDVATTLVRPVLAEITGLPAALAAHVGAKAIRTLIVGVPTESPDPSVLVPYEEAAPVIARLADEGRRAGIAVRMAPDSGPPPCVFPQAHRVAHLFALTPGGRQQENMTKVTACATCVVDDRCPGFPSAYLARNALPPLHPPTEDRVRRRLSIATSVAEQIRRELSVPNVSRTASGEIVDERIVRVNFVCNQACAFCFVSTHLPTAEDAAIHAALDEAAAADARIVLSGGEPTLNPRLVDHVRYAKARTRRRIELQTNAVLLDDRARVDELAAAGIEDAFVSLHGATAEVSDAVTEAPGTFARTLIGIDNLVAAGVRVVLNFVICQRNRGHLPRVVRLLAERWPTASLTVSFIAASTDVVPHSRELMPRYDEVVPDLTAALELARALSVQVVGFESMCGIPLCLVPVDKAEFFGLDVVPPGFDGGEFVKPPACASCALEPRCFGVRRRYLELYGASELRPVAPPTERASAVTVTRD